MYEELVKQLRYCATHECVGDGEKLVGCTAPYSEEYEGITTCNDVLQMQAADAIEELSKQIEAAQCVNIGDLDCDSSQLCTCMGIVRKRLEVAEKKSRWIPVTERLPKFGDWVLGIGPKRGYHVCEYRGLTHFPYGGDIPWFSAKGRSPTITHWMPLPEPPKEEA